MSNYYATCNLDFIDGQCVIGVTLDYPRKHLGPPGGLGIPPSSKLFQTRCGLTSRDGYISYVMDQYYQYDRWCPECLAQGGVPYVLRKM